MKRLKITVALILLLAIGIPLHYQYFSATKLTVSVKDINKGDYVSLCVLEENAKQVCNEYENTDDWLWLKWNSGTVRSQLAASMTDGTPIEVKVHGYRIELLSMRKNIVKVYD